MPRAIEVKDDGGSWRAFKGNMHEATRLYPEARYARAIAIHLHGDGHRMTTRGIGADEQHRISNAVKLAGPSAERIRAYVAECCGVQPEVSGRPRSVPPMPPPSGPMVAGD